MTTFTVRLSDIVAAIERKGDGRKIDQSTLRLMCANGVLTRYAEKDGNSWRIPLDVATDLIEHWKPYSRWEPSAEILAAYSR